MKKKIVVFTGGGVSRESGILTFRDSVDGLWENHSIDDVCTPSGWKKDREKVLNFYNDRRRQLPSVEPNSAHTDLVKLEDKYDVTIVTVLAESIAASTSESIIAITFPSS